MQKEEIISSGILEMYVMGLTSEQENLQVHQWIALFPEVKNEISRIEEDLEQYALENEIKPSAGVKEKIMRNIQTPSTDGVQSSAKAKVVNMLPFWKRLAAASVTLLLLSSLINFLYYNKYEQEHKKAGETQQQLIAQETQNRSMKEDMNVVQNKYSVPVSLQGMPDAPEAAAKIFWMKNTGEVYVDPSNLPETPQGMQYQLWAIVDGKPVDGGMIITTQKGNQYRIQKMKSFGKADAFAITLETKGGNPTPKGKMFVMGKM